MKSVLAEIQAAWRRVRPSALFDACVAKYSRRWAGRNLERDAGVGNIATAARHAAREETVMRTGMKTGMAVAVLAATLTAGVFIGEALAAQPHMQAALDDLRAARSELLEASHNKAGHRAEALRLTNAAISETEAGMVAADEGY